MMSSNKIEKSGSSLQLSVHYNGLGEPLGPSGAVNFYSLTLYSPKIKQKRQDKAFPNSIVLDTDSVRMECSHSDIQEISIIFNTNLRGCNVYDKLGPIIKYEAYELDSRQFEEFIVFFDRIYSEALSGYRYRKDLLSDLLSLLNHHILKELIIPTFYLLSAN